MADTSELFDAFGIQPWILESPWEWEVSSAPLPSSIDSDAVTALLPD